MSPEVLAKGPHRVLLPKDIGPQGKGMLEASPGPLLGTET